MGRQTKTGDYEKENRQIDPASASQPSKRHVGATMACIEDIQGCYLVASSWPDYHPEFDIHDQLAEFVERIQRQPAIGTRHSTIGSPFPLEREGSHLADGTPGNS